MKPSACLEKINLKNKFDIIDGHTIIVYQGVIQKYRGVGKLIELIKVHQQHLVGIEGEGDSEWILVDCGDVIVNIMQQEAREFYDLESLWGEKTLVSA